MFQKHFSRRKFKMLVEKCMYKREIWTKNTQIIKEGNSFTSVFIFTDVEEAGAKINLYRNDQVVHTMGNYSWLGIFEYTKVYNQTVKENIERRPCYECSAAVDDLEFGKALTYYELDIRRLEKFYVEEKKINPMAFRNGLLAVMLNFCSEMVKTTDHFIQAHSMKLRSEQALRRNHIVHGDKETEDNRD